MTASYVIDKTGNVRRARRSAAVPIALGPFGRWLCAQGIGARDITEAVVDAYVSEIPVPERRSIGEILRELLAVLRESGICRPLSLAAGGASQQILNEFRQYLVGERGLAARTIENYTEAAQAFVASRATDDSRPVKEWTTADVLTFVQRRSVNRPSVHMQWLGTGLRAFLRYLCFRGYTDRDLSECVPRIAHWRLATLPNFLSPEQLDRILLHCRQDTAAGRRDRAVLLLLARLGLRAEEIRRLELDDIHWQRGELSIRGKGRGPEPMPLPQDVGEALAAYLAHGRPASNSRSVFVRLRAPHRPYKDGGTAIGSIVRRAMREAVIDAPSKGTHIFRHTLATEMLRGGASLREIGHLLRHRHEDTTRLYAKVDLARLRTLALPWPGGAL
jgi:site-specific recombinase XerD